MLGEWIFGAAFGIYWVAFVMFSMGFSFSFREIGVKNSLVAFAKGCYYLNSILLVLFIPAVLVGVLALTIEKKLFA